MYQAPEKIISILSNKEFNILVPDKIYQINQTDQDLPTSLEQLTVREEDAWWNQMPLTNLDLSSNALTHLSPKIENLETLTTLTVSLAYALGLCSILCELFKIEYQHFWYTVLI